MCKRSENDRRRIVLLWQASDEKRYMYSGIISVYHTTRHLIISGNNETAFRAADHNCNGSHASEGNLITRRRRLERTNDRPGKPHYAGVCYVVWAEYHCLVWDKARKKWKGMIESSLHACEERKGKSLGLVFQPRFMVNFWSSLAFGWLRQKSFFCLSLSYFQTWTVRGVSVRDYVHAQLFVVS